MTREILTGLSSSPRAGNLRASRAWIAALVLAMTAGGYGAE